MGDVSAGRYRIKARIGAGAKGDVFSGLDLTTNTAVAIKVLNHRARDVDKVRFRREIRTLADLRHPGVVQYIDHGEMPDGRLFLVMEWLSGEDLARRLARVQIGMRDAVELVRRAAQATAAVHARGIIHRDLKPSNIFIEQRRQGSHSVKLIDFGLVKAPDPDDHNTQRGSFIGTPCFIAPEQARGLDIDPRVDVYSLGAVLFRLVTGRHVFETKHVMAYLGRLVLEPAPRASLLRPDVPPELDDLLAQLLHRRCEERPENAGDLARLLARLPPLSNELPPSNPTIIPPAGTAIPVDLGSADLVPDTSVTLRRIPAVKEKRVVAAMLASLASDDDLERALESKLRAIVGSSAIIEQLHGRRLVVALGLERTTGDESIRAARAALYLRRRIPTARIAIATGHAVAGKAGLTGEALERAAAQLALLDEPGVRVDEATQPALDGRFVAREDERGASLLREDLWDEETRPLLGKATATIGRTLEVESILATIKEVMQDQRPRAVLVLGPEGIGKSRVRKEVIRRLRDEAPSVDLMMARGEPMLAYRGLSDIGRALRSRMGIKEGEPAEAQALKLVRYLTQRSGFPAYAIDFIGEFVGASASDDDSQLLRSARNTPQLMSARIFNALESLLRHEAQSATQVLVIEDLEAVDETSVALVDWLLDCSDLRLVVLAFGRAEVDARFSNLWSGRQVNRIELEPLPCAACDALVSQVQPDLALPLRQRILALAGGNPLFLEELVRHTAASRSDLPLSVQALVQARLDQLPVDQRQVLRAASVFGDCFWTGALAALLERVVDPELFALEAAEVIVRHPTSRFSGQVEWAFAHALVRETAYTLLLDEDRAGLHLKASEWLVQLGEQDIAAIAQHAEHGRDRNGAARLYANAASIAYGRGQLEAALEFAARGYAAATAEQIRGECLLQRAQILSWMGRYAEALQAATEAAAHAEPAAEMWAEAQRLAGSALREEGRPADAEALLSSALQQTQYKALNLSTRARLLSEWARTLVDLGRARQALTVAERAIKTAEQAGDGATNAMLRALDARSLAVNFLGDVSAAIDVVRDVTDRADAVGEAMLATRARINLGFVLNRVGFFEDGRLVLERALEDARSLHMRAGEGFALHNIGRSLARLGETDRAIDVQQQALAIGVETGHQRLTLLCRIHWAMALCARANGDDVLQAAALVELAREQTKELPFAEVEATAAEAITHRARGATEQALSLTSRAMARLERLGAMEDGEEALRLAHVELLIEAGREQEADEALRAAHQRIVAQVRQMSQAEHREAYLTRLQECITILHLASTRLGMPPDPLVESGEGAAERLSRAPNPNPT